MNICTPKNFEYIFALNYHFSFPFDDENTIKFLIEFIAANRQDLIYHTKKFQQYNIF